MVCLVSGQDPSGWSTSRLIQILASPSCLQRTKLEYDDSSGPNAEAEDPAHPWPPPCAVCHCCQLQKWPHDTLGSSAPIDCDTDPGLTYRTPWTPKLWMWSVRHWNLLSVRCHGFWNHAAWNGWLLLFYQNYPNQPLGRWLPSFWLRATEPAYRRSPWSQMYLRNSNQYSITVDFLRVTRSDTVCRRIICTSSTTNINTIPCDVWSQRYKINGKVEYRKANISRASGVCINHCRACFHSWRREFTHKTIRSHAQSVWRGITPRHCFRHLPGCFGVRDSNIYKLYVFAQNIITASAVKKISCNIFDSGAFYHSEYAWGWIVCY